MCSPQLHAKTKREDAEYLLILQPAKCHALQYRTALHCKTQPLRWYRYNTVLLQCMIEAMFKFSDLKHLQVLPMQTLH